MWASLRDPGFLRLAGAVGAFLAGFKILSFLFFELGYFGFVGRFAALSRSLRVPGAAPEPPYHGWSILVEAFGRPSWLLGVALPTAAFVILARRVTWTRLGLVRAEKLVLCVLAGVFLWPLATSEYNAFLDRGHLLDRLVLAALAGLVWAHPAVVAPLLAFGLLALSQFGYPLGAFSITDQRLLIDTLILFSTFVLLHAAWVRPTRPDAEARARLLREAFLAAWLALAASCYVVPVLGKIGISPHGIEWVLKDELVNHTWYCLGRGWLSWVPETSHPAVLEWVGVLTRPILIGTLAVEIAPLALGWSRRTALVVVAAMGLLHLFIFALSGILFWKWILVDAGIFLLVWKLPADDRQRLFRPERAVLHAVLTLTAFWTFAPVNLSWFDSRVDTRFDVTVEGRSGTVYPMSKADMTPYEQFFSFDRYTFLVDRKYFSVGPGLRDWSLVEGIRKAGPEGLDELREAKGRNLYDPAKAAVFDDFVRKYFRTRNARLESVWPPAWFKPPRHIWQSVRGDAYRGQEPVKTVRFRFVERYRTDTGTVVLFDRIVREIQVPE